MATRDLARTVVEGGRSGGSKYGRRRSARLGRRGWRFDSDGEPYQPKAPDHYRQFADKLGPLGRWLKSRAGRAWNDVYAEFCWRYDRRTLKGWHLSGHLLDWVCCTGLKREYPWTFCPVVTKHREFCAEGGVLHHIPCAWHRPRRAQGAVSSSEAHEWARGRRVIVRGQVLFWTAGIAVPPVVDPARPWLLDRRPGMAQGDALEESEVSFWSELPQKLRAELTYQPLRPAARRGAARWP
jgi:hypothetical protein